MNAPIPPDELPPVKPGEPTLDRPDPEPDGLGEFAETIIDEDGEVETDVLEDPVEGVDDPA